MDQNFLEFCYHVICICNVFTWGLELHSSSNVLFFTLIVQIFFSRMFQHFDHVIRRTSIFLIMLRSFQINASRTSVFDFTRVTRDFFKILVCHEIRTRVLLIQGRTRSTTVPQRHMINVLLILVYIV